MIDRYEELFRYCVFVYTWILYILYLYIYIYTDASKTRMTWFLLVGVASCAYAGFQFDVI